MSKEKLTVDQVYQSLECTGKYKIVRIDKIEGFIENIVLQNVNNKSLEFDISVYELNKNYRILNQPRP